MCKNQYAFSFLPFHMIDKHKPVPKQKLLCAFDCPRNVYIAMSKFIGSLISKSSGVLGQNLMGEHIQMVPGELQEHLRQCLKLIRVIYSRRNGLHELSGGDCHHTPLRPSSTQ